MADTASPRSGDVEAAAGSNYHGNRASGFARQHNGNVQTYHYNYALRRRRSDETLREDQRGPVLLKAAAEGQGPRVRHLINLGANIDYCDDFGLTPLHHAAFSGFEDVVDILLESGADVNAMSDQLGTPLHLACIKNRETVAFSLLKARAIVTAESRLLGTPLHCAASADASPNIVHALVAKGASEHQKAIIVFEVLEKLGGQSLGWEAFLMKALFSSSEEEYFIWELSALHIAYRKSPAIIDALVKGREHTNSTCQAWEAQIASDKSLHAKEEDFAENITPLMMAVHSIDNLNRLLRDGCDIHAVDSRGLNALHLASEHGRVQAAEALIVAGIPVHSKTKAGVTSLGFAAQSGPQELIHLLIKRGADVNAPEDGGSTALHYAKNLQCAELLIDAGALLDVQGCLGGTPLHFHARRGNAEVLQLLLERGAKVDVRDHHGYTALHLAAWKNSTECIRLLVKFGASLDLRDFFGKSPLGYVVFHKSADCVKALLEAGADPNGVTNKYGEVPVGVDEPGISALIQRYGGTIPPKPEPNQRKLKPQDTEPVMTPSQPSKTRRRGFWNR